MLCFTNIKEGGAYVFNTLSKKQWREKEKERERESEKVRESTYDEEVRLVFGIKYTLCAMIKL